MTFYRMQDLEQILQSENLTEVINKPDSFGSTPLYTLLMYRDLDLIKKFLSLGANPNSVISKSGNTIMHTVAFLERADIAELLLQYGGNIHIKNNRGYTPIDLAFLAKKKDVYNLFISQTDIKEPDTLE